MMLQTILSLLLQISLFTFAAASPVASSSNTSNQIGFGAGGRVAGFIVLILDIIVFAEVLNSNRPVPNKVLWCLLVFLFPIGGVIIYGLFSNRVEHNRSAGGYEAIP